MGGPDAVMVATVDCGDDGAATVRATFGSRDTEELSVAKSPEIASAATVPTYSDEFRTEDGANESALTIWTSPTREVCTTALTDRATGNVLVQVTGPAAETVEGLVKSDG